VDELGEVALEKLGGPRRAGWKGDARLPAATRWTARLHDSPAAMESAFDKGVAMRRRGD